jgi:Uma2 family endonuclease
MTALVTQSGPGALALGVDLGLGQRCLLFDVSWQDYLAIGNALRDRPSLRLTFDRGTLEIMTTSTEHEKYKARLARLIEVLAEELNIPIEPGGNMTFQRADLERGYEHDDCYWIAHEAQVRGRLDFDSERDPPPDLAVEIEVSRSAAQRLDMFAQVGVPEVWRFDGQTLRILVLQADRAYQPSGTSLSFPGIPIAELTRFLHPDSNRDLLTVLREFRSWIRQVTTQK